MKRILLIAAIIASAITANAQTPSEIVTRMSQELAKGDTLGQAFDLVLNIPIIGKAGGRTWLLGDSYKIIVLGKEDSPVSWYNSDTEWKYDPTENTVTIKNHTKSSGSKDGEVKHLEGLDKDYDLKIDREDAKAWYMTGKKSKTNTKKDDPKKIELAVSKATYLPIYHRCKEKGITVSLENVVIGVTEEEVTFDPAKYPGVKIIDER